MINSNKLTTENTIKKMVWELERLFNLVTKTKIHNL
jgi:hypothetical protein